MPEESTTEYSMKDWLEATKDWKFITYVADEYEKAPITIYIRDTPSSRESET